MIKLRRLQVEGFRAARFPLSLDFGNGSRSIAVFGENGSGKSSISDAIEWLIRDKVGHLQAEDCYDDALRNVLIEDGDPCQASVEFSDGVANTKALSAALAASQSNKDKTFRDLIATLADDRIFLRLSDLTEFIADTKTKKRNAIASIIGYEHIVDFRNLIKSTSSQLEKDDKYTNAKVRVDESKRDLLKDAGQFITSRTELFAYVSSELKKSGFDLQVADNASFHAAILELRSKTNQSAKIERRILLDQLVQRITALQKSIELIDEKSQFIAKYNDLVEDKAKVGQIHLQGFLASGAKILEGGHAEEGRCPFCLTSYDLNKLQDEVRTRLEAVAHIAGHLEEYSTNARELFAEMANLKRAAEEGKAHAEKLEDAVGLSGSLSKLIITIDDVRTSQVAGFREYKQLAMPEELVLIINAAKALLQQRSDQVLAEIAKLEFTSYEAQIISVIERLQSLERAFSEFERNSALVTQFQSQILSLGNILDEFIKVQNSALQNVLDEISKDVGLFYKTLHPDENADGVKLKITGEEGVEFEYQFHGKATHPPRKYLSESHLNSLGLVFFLASAKLFNKRSRFLVLDDIVTSLDSNHRRRLLRLFKQYFADWQIILLTHEPLWFELIKRELGPQGWLLKEVTWDEENGARIEDSSTDIRSLIEAKRKKGIGVSNDLRKLMEAKLKEISADLEVKVAFRYNDQNERRMTGELLSELRSTINRKCSILKEHKIFSQLEASALIATVGSHDNSDSVVDADIDVALADIDELSKLFDCSKCHQSVAARNFIPAEGVISCKCGTHKLPWKQ